jgi:hypothetical protein
MMLNGITSKFYIPEDINCALNVLVFFVHA